LFAAIEQEELADRQCPVRGGKYRYEPCPKCRATPKETCKPLDLAVWAIARAGRAIATEARRAETENAGSVHEGADPKGNAQ
jgi:hypothetical protein